MAQNNKTIAQQISSLFQNLFDKMGQSNGFRKIKDELSATEKQKGFEKVTTNVQKAKASQEAKANKNNRPKPNQ